METTMKQVALKRFEKYKDSGEAWLAEVPNHWDLRKLKHLFKEKKIKHNPELPAGSISFGEVVFKDDEKIPLSTKASYQEVLPGEFLINPLNLNYDLKSLRIGLSDISVVVSSGYIVVQLASDFHKRFFKYLLHRYDVAYMKLLGSGVRQTINFNHISNSILCLPPLPEQKAIAAFLDDKCAKIDRAIALKERMIALLKERKQILIQEAVTCGVDEDGKLRKRPSELPAKGWKDSGVDWIGWIPEEWEVKKVKHLFKLIMEPAKKNNNYELLSIYTNIGVKPRKDLEQKGNRASTTDGYWHVKKGDFIVNKLLAWMGAIGLSDYNGVTSPAYDILRAKEDLCNRYFHLLFRSKICSAELKKHSRGIMEMRLRLYFDKFGDIIVPFPSKNQQESIQLYCQVQEEKIDSTIDLQTTQIQKLKEYKATLIDSVVTGKVKVSADLSTGMK